jgi:hypothetical protein
VLKGEQNWFAKCVKKKVFPKGVCKCEKKLQVRKKAARTCKKKYMLDRMLLELSSDRWYSAQNGPESFAPPAHTAYI